MRGRLQRACGADAKMSVADGDYFRDVVLHAVDDAVVAKKNLPNVWTDTAYMELDEFPKLRDYDWHGRLMFGTDLPVWQSHKDVSLTKRYREYARAFVATGLVKPSSKAFRRFLSGGRA